MAAEEAVVAAAGKSPERSHAERVLEDHYANAGYIIFRRIFARLFSLPLYAFAVAPWLFILFMTTEDKNEGLRQFFFRAFSLFAWKPGTENLNEKDIAVAMATFVLLINIVIEGVSYLKTHDAAKIGRYVVMREFVIKTALSVSGWAVFAVLIYPELGLAGSVIALVLMVVMPVFYAQDLVFKWAWDRRYSMLTDLSKLLTKHR